MRITLCRNEKESSVDRDFQRAVFGVCWGTLSPRQRHSLCCHAEGKKSTFTLLLLWIVYYGQDTNVVSLCVRLQYQENGRYMCDLPLYVSWRLACKESNWLWAWRMNMTPLMRYKTNKHKWHDYSGNRLSLCFGIMLHCFISDWIPLFFLSLSIFSMTDVVTSSRWRTSRSVDAIRGTIGNQTYPSSARPAATVQCNIRLIALHCFVLSAATLASSLSTQCWTDLLAMCLCPRSQCDL